MATALFLIPILLSPLFSTLSSALFSPRDNHLLNCGSPNASALDDRRVFLPDSPRLLSASHSLSLSAAPNPAPPPSPLYQTARIFTSPSSYSFPIQHKGTHLIRLHFYPFLAPDYNLSDALFHVSAAGFVLLANFGFHAEPNLVLKEYFINVGSDELVITFVPARRSSFAFVNAIEVFSAPADLIPDVARLVSPSRIETYHGLMKQAMETIHRINVGGAKVTPFNDTLWRTWLPDGFFFKSSSHPARQISFSGRIAYRKFGASREIAPDNVYDSARVLDGVNVSEPNSRMTWAFHVSSGYKYLVRTHFCDIASLALNELYFNVYVNGYLMYEDFDISDATSQVLASPFYVDFVVDVDESGVLNVSVGPSRLSSPLKVDALLNGLEIMKINNTMGSLSGGVPLNMVMRQTVRVGFGALARSVLCGIGFVSLCMIAFMLVMRLKAETRNQHSWSPLSTDASEGKLGSGNSVLPGKLVYF